MYKKKKKKKKKKNKNKNQMHKEALSASMEKKNPNSTANLFTTGKHEQGSKNKYHWMTVKG